MWVKLYTTWCSGVRGQGFNTHRLRRSVSSAVLTALPALAVSPQPVHAKMTGVASPSNGLVSSLEVGPVAGSAPVVSEAQKNTWLYLEELANTLLSNMQQLKALIEQAKNTSGDITGVRGHGGRKEVRGKKHQNLQNSGKHVHLIVFVISEPDNLSAARRPRSQEEF